MLARDKARRLGAALAAAAELGAWGSWWTSGPSCRSGDRLRGARVLHGRDPGGWEEGKTRNVYLGAARRSAAMKR